MMRMQLFATFENNTFLEMAITSLEKKGITEKDIFVVPLDNRKEDRKLFDTLHRSDGTSLIDIAIALSTAFAVIGASIGFRFAWGPIYWGLISASLGFVLGLVIRIFTEKVLKKRRRLLKGKHSEIIVIIDCEVEKAEMIENIMWDHFALGIAKIKSN